MTLPTTALLTLAKLKTALGISDSSRDAALEDAIVAASEMIVNYVGRPLAYDAAVVEYVQGFGSQDITLTRVPIASIASITINGATVASTEYECTGADKESGTVRRLVGIWEWTAGLRGVGVALDPLPGTERFDFAVTYAGGYTTPNQSAVSGVPTLPVVIEQACKRQATHLFASEGVDGAIKNESLMSYSVTYGDTKATLGASGLLLSVEAMLASYAFIEQA